MRSTISNAGAASSTVPSLVAPAGKPVERRLRPVRTLDDLPGPRGLPLLGNLLQIDIVRAHKTLARWADEFGPVFRFRLGRRHALGISAPDLINEVLRDRPGRFRRMEIVRNAMLDLGIAGVFTAEGPAWRRQRKLAMHALSTEHLRGFFDRLDRVTDRLQRRWERAAAANERVDAQRDLMRFTVDVTSGLVFGTDLNTLEEQGDLIQQHLDRVFPLLARRVFAPFPYWRWFRLPADRRVDAAMAKVLVLVNELVRGARARVAANAHARAKPGNFLEAMVAAQSDDPDAFTDAEIVGNALTMLLAGEDTTANTLAWMMHLMAEYPDVQRRMQLEADEALGAAVRPPDYATTQALPYIQAMALETMRLYPVAPLLGGEPTEDTTIGGVRVPKGTTIYLLAGHAASAAGNFSDPKAFRPERWLDAPKDPADGHDVRAFVPFGGGTRLCPGRQLAMLEIRMVAAMLCRNFEVARFPGAPPVEEMFTLAMMPKNLFVTLRRRQPRAPLPY